MSRSSVLSFPFLDTFDLQTVTPLTLPSIWYSCLVATYSLSLSLSLSLLLSHSLSLWYTEISNTESGAEPATEFIKGVVKEGGIRQTILGHMSEQGGLSTANDGTIEKGKESRVIEDRYLIVNVVLLDEVSERRLVRGVVTGHDRLTPPPQDVPARTRPQY